MKYFCVPADFKKETIDAYDLLNHAYPDSRVIETYGNITLGNDLESGRPVDILPEVNLAGLRYYIAYSKQRGIDFNYTINSSYMRNREFTREGVSGIYRFLGKLHDAGVRSLTVTLPSLIEVLKQFPFDFRIIGSTIYQVTNVNKALELKKLGVERIVLDESVNRNFKVLKRVRETFGEAVEIIVNSICHKDCSFRMFHYNQIAGDSVEVSSGCSNTYYPHKCLLRRYENSSNLLKLTWVRPEDLKYFTTIGINYFKLQGRPRVLKGDPVRALEAYFKEDYDGDLFELLNLFAPVSSFKVPVDNKKLDGFIKHFYENPDFCTHDCTKCRFCESFAKKCIDPGKVEEVYKSAKEYYSRLDPVKNNVQAVIDVETTRKELMAEDILQDDGEFNL
jgi:collagenase-like PrtC family protease